MCNTMDFMSVKFLRIIKLLPALTYKFHYLFYGFMAEDVRLERLPIIPNDVCYHYTTSSNLLNFSNKTQRVLRGTRKTLCFRQDGEMQS